MALEMQRPPPFDFDFNTGRESPSLDTRPSTPNRFGEVYFSAPASPARGFDNNSGFYDELSFWNYERGEGSLPSSPYNWNGRLWSFELPKTPNDYALETSNGCQIPRNTKLDTIKSPLLSPETPNSKNSQRKNSFWSTFSPKRRKEKERKLNNFQEVAGETRTNKVRGRERERASDVPASRSGRRATRSLSSLRVSKYPWEEQGAETGSQKPALSSSSSKPPLPSTVLSLSSSKGSRKWRLRDFLLFRSASEGRASEKDPFKKYAEMYRKHQSMKGFVPKSRDGSSSSPGPRRGQVSAHELHYTVNKAISQDMKKKSFLPYKQGILGRLAVNPSVHALAYGFGSVPNSYG